ncbi:MAG: Tol-Pal system beta propeller repeat protein TolB [Pseudomonadota bacterium]
MDHNIEPIQPGSRKLRERERNGPYDAPPWLHIKILFAVCTSVVFLCNPAGPVHGKLVIDVNNPNTAKMPIAIPDFVSTGSEAVDTKELTNILRNDLYMTGLFHIVDSLPAQASMPGGQTDFRFLTESGIQALIKGEVAGRGDELTLEARLYDAAVQKMEAGKRFTGRLNDRRKIVHAFADRVMQTLTGVPGCFSTGIAFVGAGKDREIYSMDFDGHNLAQLTQTGTIILSPEWAPDGRNIIFTAYLKGNPDLWSLDLPSRSRHLVSGRQGLNASARYSPRGDRIALALSVKGIPQIFLITPQGHILKRLTTGRGNDISPTWSPDGSAIAYVSDRAGAPQIYVMSSDGGPSTRLTFETKYNTDPDWSPKGDLLAFTSKIEGRFQICTIRTNGTDFRILTGEGSNQEPAWSPDGRLITFSSTRQGKQRIYVMDARGEVQVPVTSMPGKAPAWSSHGTR